MSAKPQKQNSKCILLTADAAAVRRVVGVAVAVLGVSSRVRMAIRRSRHGSLVLRSVGYVHWSLVSCAKLGKHVLLVVDGGGDHGVVYAEHGLEVVWLDVDLAHQESVISVLVEGAEVAELRDEFLAAGSELRIMVLEHPNAVRHLVLGVLELGTLLLETSDVLALTQDTVIQARNTLLETKETRTRARGMVR